MIVGSGDAMRFEQGDELSLPHLESIEGAIQPFLIVCADLWR